MIDAEPSGLRHPDSPGGHDVSEELNEPTRQNLEQLGRAELDEEPDPEAREGDDSDSPPGQNSAWLPQ